MARWILGMRWSAAGKEVQPWYPGWVRIRRGEPVPDRGDWPPENVAVLAIPARDSGVGHRDIQQREQVGILGERKPAFHGNLCGNAVPVKWSVARPKQREIRLILQTPRSGVDAHLKQFVEISSVLRAVERRWRRQTELRRPPQHPRRHRGELRARPGHSSQLVGQPLWRR